MAYLDCLEQVAWQGKSRNEPGSLAIRGPVPVGVRWNPGSASAMSNIRPRLATSFQSLPYLGPDLAAGVWLGQEGSVQRGETVLNQYLGRMSGHVKNPLVRPLLQHPAGGCHAVALRHNDINHDQVDTAPCQAEYIDGFRRVLGLEDTIPLLAENAVRDSSGDPFVVNDQDGCGSRGEGGGQQSLVVKGSGWTTDLSCPPGCSPPASSDSRGAETSHLGVPEGRS